MQFRFWEKRFEESYVVDSYRTRSGGRHRSLGDNSSGWIFWQTGNVRGREATEKAYKHLGVVPPSETGKLF